MILWCFLGCNIAGAVNIAFDSTGGNPTVAPKTVVIARDGEPQRLNALLNGSEMVSNWSIESANGAWTGRKISNAGSVGIGRGGDWDPPPGRYLVTGLNPYNGAVNAAAVIDITQLSLSADSVELTSLAEFDCYAFIKADCTMPQIYVRLLPDGLPGAVDYELNIRYLRNNRDEIDGYTAQIPASQSWDITTAMGGDFRGGRAVLTYRYANLERCITFYIRGLNPDKQSAVRFIHSLSPLWYTPYVAIHESNSSLAPVMRQFNDTDTFHRGSEDVRYTPNASGDGGFGIYQLTRPRPSAQQLWSWQANCREGVRELSGAQTYADRWMEKQREQMLDEGFDIPVPAITYGNVTFAERTGRRIEHAVAIKRYNGASGGNFCVWDNVTKQWKINPKNNLGFNYVERVCNEVK